MVISGPKVVIHVRQTSIANSILNTLSWRLAPLPNVDSGQNMPVLTTPNSAISTLKLVIWRARNVLLGTSTPGACAIDFLVGITQN